MDTGVCRVVQSEARFAGFSLWPPIVVWPGKDVSVRTTCALAGVDLLHRAFVPACSGAGSPC